MSRYVTLEALKAMEGRALLPSSWFVITQDRIDQFAACTDDQQYIHMDTERMRNSPLGATIAHGFLSLSLVAGHPPDDWPELQGSQMLLNYGLDRVRFINPVRVDSRLRFHTKILAVTEKAPGQILIKSERTLEIEGEQKPALVAELLVMVVTEAASTE